MPGLGGGACAGRPRDRVARDRQDPGAEDPHPRRHRRHPLRDQAAREVPTDPDRRHPSPRPRREDGAAIFRRAGGGVAGGSARCRRGAADSRAEGVGAEERGEHPRGTREDGRFGGRGRGADAAFRGAARRRGAGGGAARASRRGPGRGGGIRPPLGRHLQGHRSDRDRRRAAGARRAPRLASADLRRRVTGPQRDAGADPQRHPGRPADRRPGRIRQPAPAFHRLGAAQHSVARGRCQPRASRSPSTG